jgi:hypothetical protein
MAGDPPLGLHIGVDAEKVVVSPYPIRMRTGRAKRIRSGSVTEVVAVQPSGRNRADRNRLVFQLALALLVLSAVLSAIGIPWWAAAAGSVALVAFVGWAQARAARAGVLALPRGGVGRVLWTREERLAYERALAVSRRVRRTWPELGDMIDPADADRTLTRALRQLADLMARRQEIRKLRAELVDSPARQAAAAYRERVEALWWETGQAAKRMLVGINAAALAGEGMIRQKWTCRAARGAQMAVSQVTVACGAQTEAGAELAEHAAAVVAAYEELAAL